MQILRNCSRKLPRVHQNCVFSFSKCFIGSRSLHASAPKCEIVAVSVPSMGDSISEGTLVQIVKAAGEQVNADEVVAIIDTDKVSVDVNSPVAGTVVEHFAKLDETVQVGKALFSVDDSKAPELSQKVGSTPASASPVSVPAASSVNEATKATTDRKPLIRFLGKRSLLSHTSSHFEVPSSTFSPVLSDVPSSADVLSFQHVKKIPLKPAEIAAINSGIAFL